MHGLCQMYYRLRNHFGHSRWHSKMMRLKWKLVLVCLEIVLILTQDRRMVCIERTVGSEIILDTPDGRSMVCIERTIVAKIVLDTSDGTPRGCGSSGISLLSLWR